MTLVVVEAFFVYMDTAKTISVSIPAKEFNIKPNQVTFEISGRSMETDLIYDGDFVVVDDAETINNGDIVVVGLENGSYLVKHFRRENNQLKFYSRESKSNPMILTTVKNINKVVAILCKHQEEHKIYE